MIESAPFGRTGHRSSRVIFGAAALWNISESASDEALALLRQHGVNHLDTAADYGDSELHLAPWLARHPGEFFLATKTGARRGATARASLERSLERLGVDHVDLIQLHNLVEQEEWEEAFAPGGAVEALAAARDEGLTRFVGVTGHGLRIAAMHRRSLERFDFDSVLLPYSFVLMSDPGYRAEVETLLEVCRQRDVAVQTIKASARRRWEEGHAGPRYSWYEPIPAGPELERALGFVLADARLFLNTSSDLRLLRPILEAAESHTGVASTTDPSVDLLRQDVEQLQITPLFDGSALERI